MTRMLEIREGLRNFYGRYELYIKPATRFVLAIVTFLLINGNIGYMARLKSPVVAIGLALLCTFLPINATVVLAALLVLAHLSALSLEVCIVALLLFLVMFFMYFKFAPKDGYVALLTPMLGRLGISEIMPTAVGLTKQPYSILSMVCGLIIYYFLKGVKVNESRLGAVDDKAGVSKFTVALQQIVQNKELILAVIGFVAAALIVYLIRRQSAAHSWTIAVVAGNAANFLILLVGCFWTRNAAGILWIFLGTAAAVLVGLAMEFCLFHLDYARVEQVQFEDDEYYYYVKAVPKVFLSGKEKRVKQISGGRESGISKKQLADEFDIDQDLLDD